MVDTHTDTLNGRQLASPEEGEIKYERLREISFAGKQATRRKRERETEGFVDPLQLLRGFGERERERERERLVWLVGEEWARNGFYCFLFFLSHLTNVM